MIEYLVILYAVKYRDVLFEPAAANDSIERSLEPGAGIDFEPAPPDNVIPMRRKTWPSYS